MLRRTCLLVAFLLTQSIAFAATEQWMEVRSPHFRVVTNSNEKQARHIADQFERMRWMFQTLYPKRDVDPVSPIVVIAAKNGKTFESMEPSAYLASGQLKLGGLFLQTPDKNYVLLRLDAEQEHPYATVYHEYTHLQFSSDSEWMPLWLNEGIAEFIQNTEIRDKDVLIGQPSPDDLVYLRQNRLVPLPVLFKVDHNSPYYHEEQKGSVFYAESWALTHYLYINDRQKGTNRVGTYMNLLIQHEDPVSAAEKAFGDLKQLQAALESYINASSYRQFILSSKAAPIDESTYQVKNLAAVEADAARADVLAYVGREAEARTLADAVLKADPTNIQARETIGFLLFHAGQRDEARRWYGEAVKLGSTNYLTQFYFAMLSIGEDRVEAEAGLRAAIKINPRYVQAYEQLTSLLGSEERYDEAIVVWRDLENSGGTRINKPAVEKRIDLLEEDKARHEKFEADRKAQLQNPVATVSSEVVDIVPRHPTEPATGPHHEVIGVIRGVQCSYPAVIEFQVESAKKTVSLYSNNYYKLEFSTLGFSPSGELRPCSGTEGIMGMKARVQYAESSDKTVDGQVVAVELRK
jgi:tetratricopeptide (TPR) repeat protein